MTLKSGSEVIQGHYITI